MENLKPCQKVLIVEDQYLIAMMIEDAVISAGFDVCGMAACRQDAMDLFDETDIALVDVNLRDGKTGPDIGAELAAAGKTVIFMTGNPEEVASGVSGALGVISKPVLDAELAELVSYAAAHCAGADHNACPPRNLHLFA
jgi:two-component system, response regulator PdtaR